LEAYESMIVECFYLASLIGMISNNLLVYEAASFAWTLSANLIVKVVDGKGSMLSALKTTPFPVEDI
jgi:hypothetical protein